MKRASNSGVVFTVTAAIICGLGGASCDRGWNRPATARAAQAPAPVAAVRDGEQTTARPASPNGATAPDRPPPDRNAGALTGAPAPGGWLGVLLAGQSVDVAPRSEERVERVLVHPGARVTRGQPLATMDVKSLRTDLRLARSDLADAQERLARRLPLAKGVISPEELSGVRVLVAQRENHVQHLRQALADAVVTAPFDGVVAGRYVDAGSIAGPSRPIVRLISGDGDVRVRFAVPEDQPGMVMVGMRVQMTGAGLESPLEAVVDSVAPEVDPAARMILAMGRVEARPRADGALSSGVVVRVSPARDPGRRR